jgi:hypothetical protein
MAMIVSPQRNTLLGLARHCPLAVVAEPRGFTVNDARAFALGVTTIEHTGEGEGKGNWYTFLVIGDTPPEQPVVVKPGTYRVVLLRSSTPEEFADWNRSGGASRTKRDEVHCLEALRLCGESDFATTGRAGCYVNVV